MLRLYNHNIILPKYLEIVKKNGGSLIFSALGGRGKEKNVVAKNSVRPCEGEAEFPPHPPSASPEPKRSLAALLVQSRAQQKSFLFLLEEKEIARQIKKSEENFFAAGVGHNLKPGLFRVGQDLPESHGYRSRHRSGSPSLCYPGI